MGRIQYQFETIHPFLDGNGRLGRLFIVLYLKANNGLQAPLLYVSGYFDQRKSEYYERLQFVRERGEIREWLLFFLDAIAVQTADAVMCSERLSDLREKYRIALSGSRSRAPDVVDLLLARPIITVRYVQDQLGISQPGANNLLLQLSDHKILVQVGKDLECATSGSPTKSLMCLTRSVRTVRIRRRGAGPQTVLA